MIVVTIIIILLIDEVRLLLKISLFEFFVIVIFWSKFILKPCIYKKAMFTTIYIININKDRFLSIILLRHIPYTNGNDTMPTDENNLFFSSDEMMFLLYKLFTIVIEFGMPMFNNKKHMKT